MALVIPGYLVDMKAYYMRMSFDYTQLSNVYTRCIALDIEIDDAETQPPMLKSVLETMLENSK